VKIQVEVKKRRSRSKSGPLSFNIDDCCVESTVVYSLFLVRDANAIVGLSGRVPPLEAKLNEERKADLSIEIGRKI
jgi:hypothetical protein